MGLAEFSPTARGNKESMTTLEPQSPALTCFELKNRSSEVLDGTISPSLKKLADQHLAICFDCSEHFSHYRTIVDKIRHFQTRSMPDSLRQNWTKTTSSEETRFMRWKKSTQGHKFVRVVVEMLTFAMVTAMIFMILPRALHWQESKSSESLDIWKAEATGIFDDRKDATADPKTDTSASPETPTSEPVDLSTITASSAEEFSDETDVEETDLEDSTKGGGIKNLKVGRSEIWRFHLKTYSPRDFKSKVTLVLKKNGLPFTAGKALRISDVPGGVQFDLLCSAQLVNTLYTEIKALAPNDPPLKSLGTPTEAFTWYRSRSKQNIPVGSARVIIWLSQI
jgi:hypothetical protein